MYTGVVPIGYIVPRKKNLWFIVNEVADIANSYVMVSKLQVVA